MFSDILFIFIPIASRILHIVLTSLISGIFSIVDMPLTNIVAGSIATAAFFAPLIVTSPFNFVFPFYYYFFQCDSPMYLLFVL